MRKIIGSALTFAAMAVMFTAPSAHAAQRNGRHFSQSDKQQIATILTDVVAVGGTITKQTHDKFWSLLPQSVQANPESFLSKLRITKNMVYQEQLWESIRLSARTGKVTKTLYYATAFKASHGNGAKAQNDALRANEMLAAAAHHTLFHGERGARYLTEKKANKILDHLNAATARLKLLVDPIWQGP